jgi:phage gpG-like protein
MVELRIETIGAERFVRAFNRIGEDVKDFREPFNLIADDFAGIEKRSFREQGWPSGWAPLTRRYAEWKAVHYPGRKILERTGALAESMAGQGAFAVRDVRERQATFGTSLRYAIFHQLGTRRMVARKVVQLSDDMKVGWGRIVHKWAVDLMKREVEAARQSAGLDREFRGITR